MEQILSSTALAALQTRVAVLSFGRYALPVRLGLRGQALECRVPTWSGVGDQLAESADPPPEVTLVAVEATEPHLRWLFIRGPAALVPDPDWDDLPAPATGGAEPGDLYQVVRIVPKRIERVDAGRGWGCRETFDR